ASAAANPAAAGRRPPRPARAAQWPSSDGGEGPTAPPRSPWACGDPPGSTPPFAGFRSSTRFIETLEEAWAMPPLPLFLLAPLLVAALFLLWPRLDLAVAGWFYLGRGHFLLESDALTRAIRASLPYLMQLAAAAVVIMLALDLVRRRDADAAIARA